MADDPYVVLGVARAATDDEIKSAYRSLAKKYHPDRNPGDHASAERFKKVSAAYDLLGDPEKKRRFDRGEIDANGEQRRPQYRPGGGMGAGARRGRAVEEEDEIGLGGIFADLFGGRGAPGGARTGFTMRGQDVRYTLEVDFLEAAAGTRKRVTLPDGGVLDLNVPAGVGDGQQLRLRGKGAPGARGGEPGDALVEIRVRAHPVFRRTGDDISSEVAVTLYEAVLGARIEVATIAGRVQLSIPKGTSSGRVFRLKGKGIANATTGAIGDHLVSVRIELPAQVDDSLAYFMSEWAQKHPYNPRG
jgi:DnaJ-class molecular chaperone